MVKRISISGLIRLMAIGILWLFISISAKVERMDIFDKDGNNLLFVNFEYNADGKNTGRSIYASDSTFLRRTVFITDNAGNREKEVSLNYNDDTISYTNITTSNNKPAITVFDQFNLDQFGAPVSFDATSENTYEVHHNGSVAYKIKYTYNPDGDLKRVEVLSTENEVLYYATFLLPLQVVKDHSRRKKYQQEITFSANRYSISANLEKKSHLRVCIYDVSGRLVSVPYEKNLNPGVHNVRFMSGNNEKKPAGGLYIFRIYINGKPYGSFQKCILKTRGAG